MKYNKMKKHIFIRNRLENQGSIEKLKAHNKFYKNALQKYSWPIHIQTCIEYFIWIL